MLTAGSVLDLTFSYLYSLWSPGTKTLLQEAKIFNQAREIYGKNITILFRYMISWTKRNMADGSYSHK